MERKAVMVIATESLYPQVSLLRSLLGQSGEWGMNDFEGFKSVQRSVETALLKQPTAVVVMHDLGNVGGSVMLMALHKAGFMGPACLMDSLSNPEELLWHLYNGHVGNIRAYGRESWMDPARAQSCRERLVRQADDSSYLFGKYYLPPFR